MAYVYEEKYASLLGEEYPIHWSTKFGKNVRIGHGVIIEKDCEIGDNVIITHHCVLRPGTKIGNNSVVSHLTVFEGDSIIGDRVLIEPQCHITKGCVIEDDVFIGPGTITTNTKNIVHGRDIELVLAGPMIRRAARIGGACHITPGVTIGENSFIGMGSTVTKNVPPREMWLGSPAKYYKDIPEEEILNG